MLLLGRWHFAHSNSSSQFRADAITFYVCSGWDQPCSHVIVALPTQCGKLNATYCKFCSECSTALKESDPKRGRDQTDEPDPTSRVVRTRGETLGRLDAVVELHKFDPKRIGKLESRLIEKRIPFLVMRGWKPKVAAKLCNIQ